LNNFFFQWFVCFGGIKGREIGRKELGRIMEEFSMVWMKENNQKEEINWWNPNGSLFLLTCHEI